jgi:hypothetical protein
MDAICGVGALINSIDGEASAASLGNMGHDVLQKATRKGIVEQVKQSSTKSKNGNRVKDLMTPNLCVNVAAVMLPTYQA